MWTCTCWQIWNPSPPFHPTTTNPPPVWFVPLEGYVRLVRASGRSAKRSLKRTNPQLLQMWPNDPRQFDGSGRKGSENVFLCAEWAFSFPCWFESRVCAGHPCRWFSIFVSFEIRIASKESVISVYGVNETLFSVLRRLDWLKKQTSAVKIGINLSSTQEGYIERAKTDSSSDWCFPLSHPVSFLCLEENTFARNFLARFICYCWIPQAATCVSLTTSLGWLGHYLR